MSVVWIVEKNLNAEFGLASSLWGDFAVRAFASLETVAKFVKLRSASHPDLVLLNIHPAEIKEGTVRELQSKGINLVVNGSSPKNKDVQPLLPELNTWSDTFELIAQVKTLLKMRAKSKSSALAFKDISLDMDTFELVVLEGDEREHLPKKEAFILKLLLQKPGEVLSRDEIKSKVWAKLVVTERTIDSHVSRLRKRLNSSETTIQSIYGGGYTLV